MSDSTNGVFGWHDLTVDDAPKVRDFYTAVAGWSFEEHDMGGYSDYVMKTQDGEPVSGVCHKRGANANVPAQWILYVVVEDIAASVKKCTELGGEVLDGPREAGGGTMCIVKDPAGAVCGLYQ